MFETDNYGTFPNQLAERLRSAITEGDIWVRKSVFATKENLFLDVRATVRKHALGACYVVQIINGKHIRKMAVQFGVVVLRQHLGINYIDTFFSLICASKAICVVKVSALQLHKPVISTLIDWPNVLVFSLRLWSATGLSDDGHGDRRQ